MQEWTSQQVVEWLKAMKLSSCVDSFKSRQICGKDLASLTEQLVQVNTVQRQCMYTQAYTHRPLQPRVGVYVRVRMCTCVHVCGHPGH